MEKLDANILIIDDDPDILQTSRMVLKKHFSMIRTEKDPHKLDKLLREVDYDLVLLDMNFKAGLTTGLEGIAWLKKIKQINPQNHVVMITAYGDVKLAVQAMKEGATDFVVKPWDNQKLLATVMSACKLSQSKREVDKYKNREDLLTSDMDKAFSTIIGKSAAMKNVFNICDKVSQTDANVLILGENGTGKEMIARDIHRKSKRAKQIFISVDLGALPETLFESELFGHVKGAFTDAHQDKVGRFEVASGGTLFLDEIGNLSLPLQAKLLSVLEKREVYKIGSSKAIPIDIRLICATNMPLHEMIAERRFRDDLLYRINTVEINLPPLRNRKGDVLLLTDYFMETYAKKYHKMGIKIMQDARRKMESYFWPGIIRELQHVIERATIMAESNKITANELLLTAEAKTVSISETLNIEELEKNAIQKAMQKHAGNLSNAARDLGLGRTTLYRKMEKYGL
jgi:two-component system, NtrC family, response regulator HydG